MFAGRGGDRKGGRERKREFLPVIRFQTSFGQHPKRTRACLEDSPWDFVSKPASVQQENKLSERQGLSHTCSNTDGPRDYHHQGCPGGSHGKESAHNAGDPGSTAGLRRSPGEGYGNPLQYSCLENPLGQRSLLGYSPWGCKESDMTEQIHFQRLSY